MKKYILGIIIILLVSCSKDTPTAPDKVYPISHKDLAQSLAIKINEIRDKENMTPLDYIENVVFEYNSEKYDFNYVTNNYYYPSRENSENIKLFESEDGTKNIYFSKYDFYLDNLNHIVESLITYKKGLPNWYSVIDGHNGKKETVAINIIELANPFPRTDDFGEKYWQFGKQRIVVYIYIETEKIIPD